MHLALALMPFLFWVGYLAARMRDYTSLFSSGTDVAGFVAQDPKVLAHPYVSCLILLSNIVVVLPGVWNLVSFWRKRKLLVGEATEKRALR